MFSTLFLEFQNWALISGEWGAGWCLTGVFCMIQMLIKNTLREVENYPTYGIPNILREVGNIKNMIKKGRKSSQWVFGIHQYIKGCRKS